MSDTSKTMQEAMDLHQRGQLDDAERLYLRVLDQQPAHFGATHLSGLVLLQRGQAGPAQAQLARAVAINDGVPEAHQHLGNALLALDRCEEALGSYEKALALQPDNPRLHFSRANTLVELERMPEAMAAFDAAIALSPEFDAAYLNRGVLRLLLGDYAGGLPDYEHRRPRNPARRMLPGLKAPDWDGQKSLAGCSILVSDATGLGDVLQFCRYLPMLADRGAAVSFLGNARLIALLRTLDPRIELLSALDEKRDYDFQCKLLSLPFLFGTDADSIPSRGSYLKADPLRVARWKDRIGDQGYRIGVCWRGNPSRTIDGGRAIPLAGLESLSRIRGVRLLSLQKRFGLEELDSLPAGMSVETLGEDFDEGPDAFLDSAAVLANIDLVITSCTSMAHLAGALGVPTWVALKRVPEWRWGLEATFSPWYPGHTLFRQHRRADWSGVFEAMAQEVGARVAPLQAQPGD